MTEASLTHFPREKKLQVLAGIAKHSEQYLLHEICLTCDDDNTDVSEAVKGDMQKVLRVGFFPETVNQWCTLLKEAGFSIQETGSR